MQNQKKQRQPEGAFLVIGRAEWKTTAGAIKIGVPADGMAAWTKHGNHLVWYYYSIFLYNCVRMIQYLALGVPILC